MGRHFVACHVEISRMRHDYTVTYGDVTDLWHRERSNGRSRKYSGLWLARHLDAENLIYNKEKLCKASTLHT
jgi:hypothetical protein